MVVAPRSAFESHCPRCQHSLSEELPVCPQCGALRALPDGDYFQVLGIPRGLGLDENRLRDRYYEITKRTHPDRYAQSAPAEGLLAARWTTAVNRAYQTLRDPERRARYLLDLAGMGDADKKASIPLDLAETYFEIQDLLGEPEGADRLAAFRKDLEAQLAATGGEWERIAALWSTDEKAALVRLSALVVKRKYLSSMLHDMDQRTGVSSDRRH